MTKQPRTLLITGVAIAAILAISIYLVKKSDTERKLASAPTPGPVHVETSEVKLQHWGTEVQSVGTIQSFSGITLRAQISGRITEVNTKSGAAVTAGQRLFEINPEVLKAQLEQDKAQLEISQFNYERMKELYDKRQIALQALTEAKSQYDADLATIKTTEQKLSLATTFATFDGIVGLTRVEVGDEVEVNQELATLESSERLRVEFSIPQRYVSLVSAGDDVQLREEPPSSRAVLAKVYAIDPLIDQATRTANIRAELPAHSFVPGSYVDVTLTLDDIKEVLTVPQTAIQRSLYGDSVYKVVDGKASLTHVELGTRRGGDIAITEGLKAGDTVVSAGLRKLSDGAAIQGSPAENSPAGVAAPGDAKGDSRAD